MPAPTSPFALSHIDLHGPGRYLDLQERRDGLPGVLLTLAGSQSGRVARVQVCAGLSPDQMQTLVMDLTAALPPKAPPTDQPIPMTPGQEYQAASGMSLVAMTKEGMEKVKAQGEALVNLLRVVNDVANVLETQGAQLQSLIKLGNGAANNDLAFDLRQVNDKAVQVLREALAAVGSLG